MATASLAWACVPQPLLDIQPPASARAGDTVRVRGLNFPGASEIRLNAIDGPRLATGSGRRFTVRVEVPKVRPGLYVLVGVSRDGGGGLSAAASAPLQVLPSQTGGASAGGPAPSARPPVNASPPVSSTGIAALPAAAGGVVLAALGILLGTVLAGRRRRASQR